MNYDEFHALPAGTELYFFPQREWHAHMPTGVYTTKRMVLVDEPDVSFPGLREAMDPRMPTVPPERIYASWVYRTRLDALTAYREAAEKSLDDIDRVMLEEFGRDRDGIKAVICINCHGKGWYANHCGYCDGSGETKRLTPGSSRS